MLFEDDYLTELTGEAPDAEMMKRYLAAWGDREAMPCRMSAGV